MGGGSVMLVRPMLVPFCAWIDMAMSSDCNNEASMLTSRQRAPDGGHYVKACSTCPKACWFARLCLELCVHEPDFNNDALMLMGRVLGCCTDGACAVTDTPSL